MRVAKRRRWRTSAPLPQTSPRTPNPAKKSRSDPGTGSKVTAGAEGALADRKKLIRYGPMGVSACLQSSKGALDVVECIAELTEENGAVGCDYDPASDFSTKLTAGADECKRMWRQTKAGGGGGGAGGR